MCELTKNYIDPRLPKYNAFEMEHETKLHIAEVVEQQRMGLVSVTELVAHLLGHNIHVRNLFLQDETYKFEMLQHNVVEGQELYSIPFVI